MTPNFHGAKLIIVAKGADSGQSGYGEIDQHRDILTGTALDPIRSFSKNRSITNRLVGVSDSRIKW
jgi:hypothetical protein